MRGGDGRRVTATHCHSFEEGRGPETWGTWLTETKGCQAQPGIIGGHMAAPALSTHILVAVSIGEKAAEDTVLCVGEEEGTPSDHGTSQRG